LWELEGIVEFLQFILYGMLSKVWFVHSNSSLESSAGIGVLSMAKQEMLRMLGKTGEGEGNNQFWVLDKDVS